MPGRKGKTPGPAGNGAAPDDLVAYAMTALHNRARSHWRTRKPVHELHKDMATTLPDAPCRIACAELRAALTRITGQPVGTVMSRLARARHCGGKWGWGFSPWLCGR